MGDDRPGEVGRARRALRARARCRLPLFRVPPARLLLIGYASWILAGRALPGLPWALAVPVAASDNLFISDSAVSTTGLVPVDPGTG